MDDDIEPHAGVTETAKFVALACVASRLIGLNAQPVHMPGHRIDLAGEAGNPEGVDDVLAGDKDVDRSARGQMQDVSRLHPAMIGIAECPGPLLSHGLDPRRRDARQRQQPRRRQRIGDKWQQDDGRQNQAAEHDPAPGRDVRAPARTPDHQHEQHHHQREENGRAHQHHPPQRGDRSPGRPGGIERRQRPIAAGKYCEHSDLDHHAQKTTMST